MNIRFLNFEVRQMYVVCVCMRVRPGVVNVNFSCVFTCMCRVVILSLRYYFYYNSVWDYKCPEYEM